MLCWAGDADLDLWDCIDLGTEISIKILFEMVSDRMGVNRLTASRILVKKKLGGMISVISDRLNHSMH
jgi:hypothetical protein